MAIYNQSTDYAIYVGICRAGMAAKHDTVVIPER